MAFENFNSEEKESSSGFPTFWRDSGRHTPRSLSEARGAGLGEQAGTHFIKVHQYPNPGKRNAESGQFNFHTESDNYDFLEKWNILISPREHLPE